MSKAACKIILCLGALVQAVGDLAKVISATMIQTHEAPADRIVDDLEELTVEVKRVSETVQRMAD
jgi:hypothetical protein